MGELPCPSPPSAPAQPVITKNTTTAIKEMLITDYDDHLASYESKYSAYKTWLDVNAQTDLVLMANMEDRFSAEIVELE
jgi:hypothetical protein